MISWLLKLANEIRFEELDVFNLVFSSIMILNKRIALTDRIYTILFYAYFNEHVIDSHPRSYFWFVGYAFVILRCFGLLLCYLQLNSKAECLHLQV